MAARKRKPSNKDAQKKNAFLLPEEAPKPQLQRFITTAPKPVYVKLPVRGTVEENALKDYGTTGRWPSWYLKIVGSPPQHLLNEAERARKLAQARFDEAPSPYAPTIDIPFSGMSIGLVVEPWKIWTSAAKPIRYAERVALKDGPAAIRDWAGVGVADVKPSIHDRIKAMRAKLS